MRSEATPWVRANAVEINATRNTAATICNDHRAVGLRNGRVEQHPGEHRRDGAEQTQRDSHRRQHDDVSAQPRQPEASQVDDAERAGWETDDRS